MRLSPHHRGGPPESSMEKKPKDVVAGKDCVPLGVPAVVLQACGCRALKVHVHACGCVPPRPAPLHPESGTR